MERDMMANQGWGWDGTASERWGPIGSHRRTRDCTPTDSNATEEGPSGGVPAGWEERRGGMGGRDESGCKQDENASRWGIDSVG